MIYIIVFIVLLYFSYVFDIRGKVRYKRTVYIAIQLFLILFAGLRYRIGGDTMQYIYSFYHVYPTLSDFSFVDYPIGKDPLFVLINSLVLSLGGRFYWVQLIQSSFVVILVFKYFERHSRYLFTCAFFFFLLCYTYYCMEIMRASISIAVSLYANDYIMEKKWIKGVLLYFVSIIFHAQAILLLLLPLFFSLKLNIKGVLVLVLAFISGIVIQKQFGDFISLMMFSDSINSKAEWYANEDIYSESFGNINYFIVFIMPLIIYPLMALLYMKRYGFDKQIERLQPFVMLSLSFLFIQINFQIAFRYVDYYLIYIIILLVELFMSLVKRCNLELKLSYARACVIFLPFFMLICWRHYRDNSPRFTPYYSVMNRKIDKTRENYFDKWTLQANINEY